MSESITISLSAEVLDQINRKKTEEIVDEEIEKFNTWFRSLGNDPLVRSEIAAVKTFIWYKLFAGKDGTQTNRSG